MHLHRSLHMPLSQTSLSLILAKPLPMRPFPIEISFSWLLPRPLLNEAIVQLTYLTPCSHNLKLTHLQTKVRLFPPPSPKRGHECNRSVYHGSYLYLQLAFCPLALIMPKPGCTTSVLWEIIAGYSILQEVCEFSWKAILDAWWLGFPMVRHSILTAQT